jgi:hypothetical protein
MRALLSVIAMVSGAMGKQGYVPALVQPSPEIDDGCWQAKVYLSSAQTKARLRSTSPVISPLLYNSMRITNATLLFKIAVDREGNVACVQAISGHPLILGAAIDAIRKWKFRPVRISGQRQPMVGTLILVVSGTDRGIKTKVLSAEPARGRSIRCSRPTGP